MKILFSVLVFGCCLWGFAAPRPAEIPFDLPAEMEYDFLPKRKMTLIDGVVKNKDARALSDIDAEYSAKVEVDGIVFELPGEICDREGLSACYKADLNGDAVPDYVFVNVKVWNGRFCGRSDVAAYVSDTSKKYAMNVFETERMGAVEENGKILLVKYAYSDDHVTMIRQFYRFAADGTLRLERAEAFRHPVFAFED